MKVSDLRLYSYATLIFFVMLSFVLVVGEVRHYANAIDQVAFDVADNAAPSIMLLSAARGEVRDLRVRVEKYLNRVSDTVPASPASFRATCRHIHRLTEQYQALPAFPGERRLWDRENRALEQLDSSVDHLITLFEQQRLEEAAVVVHGEFNTASTEAVDAMMVIIEFNARECTHLALQVRKLRASLARSTIVLSSLGGMLTLITVLVIGVSIRRWALFRESQRVEAVERAGALERFAGQVAHDILNPVATVSYVLAGIERSADEEKRNSFLDRGKAAVRRVQQILDGLLKFACAGAQPEPGVRTDVNAVLAELGAELAAQAAESGIELRVEPCPPCSAACNPGILNSLLSNLAHNAIKYMGTRDERRIYIRVIERGPRLRFEVEDTGPGLPPGFEKVVFESYMRGSRGTQPGFGLGLATVKTAAQAHGGNVGVRSELGRGCSFWFELPKAQ